MTCVVLRIVGYGLAYLERLAAAVASRDIGVGAALREENRHTPGMPQVKHLEDGLWELRVSLARNQYRIVYFLFAGVVLSCFTDSPGSRGE